eukprot:m.65799 g.65799  ORF g.65799 m.65799 type:complete len:559 (+) comp8315_c0_seq2:269-1945(+)
MATIKWPFCYTEFHVMCQALEMLEMEMDDDDSSVQHGTFRTPSESFTDALQKRLDELVHVAVSSDQQRHVLQRLYLWFCNGIQCLPPVVFDDLLSTVDRAQRYGISVFSASGTEGNESLAPLHSAAGGWRHTTPSSGRVQHRSAFRVGGHYRPPTRTVQYNSHRRSATRLPSTVGASGQRHRHHHNQVLTLSMDIPTDNGAARGDMRHWHGRNELPPHPRYHSAWAPRRRVDGRGFVRRAPHTAHHPNGVDARSWNGDGGEDRDGDATGSSTDAYDAYEAYREFMSGSAGIADRRGGANAARFDPFAAYRHHRASERTRPATVTLLPSNLPDVPTETHVAHIPTVPRPESESPPHPSHPLHRDAGAGRACCPSVVDLLNQGSEDGTTPTAGMECHHASNSDHHGPSTGPVLKATVKAHKPHAPSPTRKELPSDTETESNHTKHTDAPKPLLDAPQPTAHVEPKAVVTATPAVKICTLGEESVGDFDNNNNVSSTSTRHRRKSVQMSLTIEEICTLATQITSTVVRNKPVQRSAARRVQHSGQALPGSSRPAVLAGLRR